MKKINLKNASYQELEGNLDQFKVPTSDGKWKFDIWKVLRYLSYFLKLLFYLKEREIIEK